MFMDFAWPWRDGSKTEEYNTTANIYSNVFEKSKISNIEIWDKATWETYYTDASNNFEEVAETLNELFND